MPINRIKLARVKANYSQEELAEMVGVTRQTIGLIESGNYNPTINLCLKIAHTLNHTLDDLFGEAEHDQ